MLANSGPSLELCCQSAGEKPSSYRGGRGDCPTLLAPFRSCIKVSIQKGANLLHRINFLGINFGYSLDWDMMLTSYCSDEHDIYKNSDKDAH